MTARTIKEQWESYIESWQPNEVDSKMQTSFYAGAAASVVILSSRQILTPKKIRAKWEPYGEACTNHNAPPEQVKGLQHSFYAGFTSLLSIIINASNASMSVEAKTAVTKGLKDEILAFRREKP